MTKDEIKKEADKFLEGERLDEKGKKTITGYKNAINKFIEFLPDEEFLINKELVINFKSDLVDKGFLIKSRNLYIVAVNKFLKFLGHKDCVVKKFKEQEKSSIDDPIWEQEHKRMLRWAKKLNMEEDYWILRTFADSGARVEELKYFKVEKLEENYIKIYNKGKERVLIITNELRRGLKKYCKENKIKEGYIFRSPDARYKDDPNRKIDNSTVWRHLKKIAAAAKINVKKVHPHAWRHLFAKQCKNVGIDLDELQDILGHKNIQTTALYTKTSNREKKEKLERLWKK